MLTTQLLGCLCGAARDGSRPRDCDGRGRTNEGWVRRGRRRVPESHAPGYYQCRGVRYSKPRRQGRPDVTDCHRHVHRVRVDGRLTGTKDTGRSRRPRSPDSTLLPSVGPDKNGRTTTTCTEPREARLQRYLRSRPGRQHPSEPQSPGT